MSGASIPRITPRPEGLRGRLAAIAAAISATLATACGSPAPTADDRALADRQGVTPLTIDDPLGHWAREGFVELVPPTRLPSSSPRIDQIEIWLRLPADAVITTEVGDDGGPPRLRMPHGAIAERVEYAGEGARRFVADVRGTRFGRDGRERFRVLRPRAPDPDAPLVGFEWDRGDEAQQAEVTARMIELLTTTPPVQAMAEDAQARAIARFRQINACAPCHRPNKPVNRREREGGLPNRATDASGLYTVATVLADEAPIERYRRHGRDHGDPFITFWCGLEGPVSADSDDIARTPTCADGAVPTGRIDLPAALAAGDPHARALCRARIYLHRHLDAAGQRAFAGALAPCVGVDPEDPASP